MRTYFLRRFLLIPPTLFGITLMVFLMTRILPGGPMDRAIMEARSGEMGSGAGVSSRGGTGGGALSQEQMQSLREYYGLDKPPVVAYFQWLGKVVQGDLGRSYRYGEPVSSIIAERLPVSLMYGTATLFLVYAVCLPLGILKAIKHRTFTDSVTSVMVFFGYAIPGYALGAVLVVYAAARWRWFPMGGFHSDDFEAFSLWQKITDLVHHAVLPLICYSVGSFAFVTLLLKNQLLDNLSADFVRTAVAKGVSFRRSVFKHALRNSLIPLATYFGQSVTALIGGSFLVEVIFDIDGMGLLGYTSVVDRDYPTVMGVLLLSSFLLLIGHIIADVLVALADPRIRFK
ncbi:MAG: ABC transporter permease [Opitutus sp.]